MAEEEAMHADKDDHDNRVLKFADRYALADKNKVQFFLQKSKVQFSFSLGLVQQVC